MGPGAAHVEVGNRSPVTTPGEEPIAQQVAGCVIDVVDAAVRHAYPGFDVVGGVEHPVGYGAPEVRCVVDEGVDTLARVLLPVIRPRSRGEPGRLELHPH